MNREIIPKLTVTLTTGRGKLIHQVYTDVITRLDYETLRVVPNGISLACFFTASGDPRHDRKLINR